jgi:hypothetical protein
MEAAFVIDARAWDDTLSVAAAGVEDGLHYVAFSRGLAAYHRGDAAGMAAALDALRPLGDDEAPILALELEGLTLLADDPPAALAKLRQAAAAEAALPYMFGPPSVIKPASELLGEVLAGLDRASEAAAAFRLQLERTPGRAASLLGLARAYRRAGSDDLASEAYGRLARVWEQADEHRSEVREARAGAGAR